MCSRLGATATGSLASTIRLCLSQQHPYLCQSSYNYKLILFKYRAVASTRLLSPTMVKSTSGEEIPMANAEGPQTVTSPRNSSLVPTDST